MSCWCPEGERGTAGWEAQSLCSQDSLALTSLKVDPPCSSFLMEFLSSPTYFLVSSLLYEKEQIIQ
jgi:hypothetical protein